MIGSGFALLPGDICRGAADGAASTRRGDTNTLSGARTEQRKHAACLDDNPGDNSIVTFGKFCIGTRVQVENLRANTQDGSVVECSRGKPGA